MAAAMKVLAVALALVATAVVVRAEEPHADVAHAHHKTIELYILTTTPFGSETTQGSTTGLIRTVSETSGGAKVGTIYQSGIVVDTSGDKLVNFQGTIVLDDGYSFPAGKIFYIGDGTGASATSFLPKSIVGGTGPYTHAEGKITRAPGGPYTITIFNW